MRAVGPVGLVAAAVLMATVAASPPASGAPRDDSGAVPAAVDSAARVAGDALQMLAAAGEQAGSAVGDPADYRFLLGSADRPTRWNPCAPITWAFASDPLGETQRMVAAFAKASDATGIAFRRLPDGSAAQVRVTLQSAADADVSGDGGMHFTTVGTATGAGLPVATSGYVDAVIGAASPAAMRTSLYLHELGHVLGLDHVDAADEVMFERIDAANPLTAYSRGDLEGLRRLGRSAGCQNPPPPVVGLEVAGMDVKPSFVRAQPGRRLPTFHPTRILAFTWRQPPADPAVMQTLAFQVDRANPTDEAKWLPVPFDEGFLGAGTGNMGATARIGGEAPCRAGDQFVLVAYNAYGRSVNPVTLTSCRT